MKWLLLLGLLLIGCTQYVPSAPTSQSGMLYKIDDTTCLKNESLPWTVTMHDEQNNTYNKTYIDCGIYNKSTMMRLDVVIATPEQYETHKCG